MKFRYRRLVAFSLGLGICVFLLLVLEVAAYVFLQSPHRQYFRINEPTPSATLSEDLKKYSMSLTTTMVEGEVKWSDQVFFAEDRKQLHYGLTGEIRKERDGVLVGFHPNVSFHRKSFSKKYGTFFDTQVDIDQWGRRKTAKNPKAKSHILVLGCSYAYGEGVEDDETLSSWISRLSPEHQGYNVGMGGSSIAGVLARMQLEEWSAGIQEPNGVAVYLFIADHVRRAQSFWNGLDEGSVNQPYMEDLGGSGFKFKGSLGRNFPIQAFFVKIILRSNIVHLLRLHRLLYWTDSEIDRFARMVLAAKNEYLRFSPEGKFYLVFYPGEQQTVERLAPFLEKYKISFLYYQPDTLLKLGEKEPRIYGNGHPSSSAHKELAQLLIHDLHL